MEEWVLAALRSADHGILVTVAPDGSPRPVPFTFAVLDDRIVGAVDHKPKRTTRLARLADLQRTSTATVLVEHYEDDWRRLWWVRVTGSAAVHDPADDAIVDALMAKYGQYADNRPAGPTYAVRIEEVRAWRSSDQTS